MSPALKELRKKVRKLEIYQKRFLEDPQACMPLVSDHKKLKDKIAALKERYVDKKYNSMDDPTVARYNHKIAPPHRKSLFFVETYRINPAQGSIRSWKMRTLLTIIVMT